MARLAFAAALSILAPAAAAERWGAIRWDAFINASSSPDSVGAIVARVLKPLAWHDRLPWYSWLNNDGNWTFDCTSRATMDAEIAMAVAAGIDHWVFDIYPPADPMTTALASFLASPAPAKASLSFAVLLQTSFLVDGGLAALPAKAAIYGAYMARADYICVLDNRPVIYLFAVTEAAWGNASAGWRDWAAALGMIAAAARGAGRGAPYYVLQTWDARGGAAARAGINAAAGAAVVPALSAYALAGATDAGTPWATFADGGEAFWNALAATGADVVPPVAAGWDNRPRNETAVPWQPVTDPAFVVGPTPAELAAFVARAQNWTRAHAAANPAQLHLLSAWNEYDEGHWIGAVLPEFGGNARLEAIGEVLRAPPRGDVAAPPRIDRRAVVARHDVRLALPVNGDDVTSLGNGAFAFNVDITGLQSLNATYRSFDLNTLADWAYHTSFAGSDALRDYNYTDYNTTIATGTARRVRYPTGHNASAAAGAWLHNNPHKLPLAQVSLAWAAAGGGEPLVLADLVNATQTLDAWAGAAASAFTVAGARPDRGATDAAVYTTVHPAVDALAARVELVSRQAASPLPLVLRLAFPYTTSGAADWGHDGSHTTTVVAAAPGRFTVERAIDGDGYRVDCAYNATWALAAGASPHVLVLSPPPGAGAAATDLVCLFAPRAVAFPVGAATPWLAEKRAQTLALQAGGGAALPGYTAVAAAAAAAWGAYWEAGAFVDLAGATGAPDALELERRVVRSLYLLRALEAGAEPPAETGLLLAGNWAGKLHGEMRFWHQAWAPHWGRADVLARSDAWYADFLGNATSNAAAQGYAGARWPKMIAVVANRSAGGADVAWVGLAFAPLPAAVHGGDAAGLAPLLGWESSSPVGPLLVWQQSHSVFLAEAQRRAAAAAGGAAAALAVMQRLAPVVFATADFLATFAVRDAAGVYHLLPPLYGGEEQGDPLAISDPAFELVQVGGALDTAAAWRDALGLPPAPSWEAVRGHLAAPPLDAATAAPPLYATNAACACLYARGACAFARAGCPAPLVSHPMTAGLHGMLNGLADDGGRRNGLRVESVNATVAEIAANWTWGTAGSSPQVWGWDAPLVALAVARLGWAPESVVSTLLLPFNKNTYDAQGHNRGMGNSTAYFPGNGGTLLAVAGIAGGFDGGAPGAQLRAGGPGAVASSPAPPVGFPAAWRAVVEGFVAPLP